MSIIVKFFINWIKPRIFYGLSDWSWRLGKAVTRVMFLFDEKLRTNWTNNLSAPK